MGVKRLAVVLTLAGLVVVTVGVGLIYLPAAVITAGILLLVMGGLVLQVDR